MNVQRIDIHRHISAGQSAAGLIATMDRHGITGAVLSAIPAASSESRSAAETSRRWNDFAAELISRHPTRLQAFALVPSAADGAAQEELAYAFDTLGFGGVLLPSNANGIYPGDHRFASLFAELDRRRAVVFVHPVDGPDDAYSRYVEYVHDTARAVASLADSGYLMKYRGIRYILAHAGGSLPFVSTRVAGTGINISMGYAAVMRRYLAAFRSIRHMYLDCACLSDPVAARCVSGLSGGRRLLYGTNSTHESEHETAGRCIELLAGSMGVPCSRVERTMEQTARDLFPAFEQSQGTAGRIA